jgi:hypothetical protein
MGHRLVGTGYLLVNQSSLNLRNRHTAFYHPLLKSGRDLPIARPWLPVSEAPIQSVSIRVENLHSKTILT